MKSETIKMMNIVDCRKDPNQSFDHIIKMEGKTIIPLWFELGCVFNSLFISFNHNSIQFF